MTNDKPKHEAHPTTGQIATHAAVEAAKIGAATAVTAAATLATGALVTSDGTAITDTLSNAATTNAASTVGIMAGIGAGAGIGKALVEPKSNWAAKHHDRCTSCSKVPAI